MLLETRVLTCLDKVFYDEAPLEADPCLQGFENERMEFQVAFRASDVRWEAVEMEIHSSLADHIKVRQVRQVPVQYAVPEDAREDCLRTRPGLYPDLLTELKPHALHASPRWSCLWFTVEPGEGLTPGVYPIEIAFRDGEGTLYPVRDIRAEVLPGLLPPQTLIHTKWFHCDCLSQYYHVEVFSEEHWRLIENFMRAAVRGGINMILMPVHTPPLDTRPGGSRRTVQLVDIAADGDGYHFDMSRVRRWIALCRKCGVEYYEIAHLFSQWGAAHAPRIMATVNGEARPIFGWDTDAAGEEYGRFLRAYIPALRACFREEGMEDRAYWHISDEPHQAHLESYAAARRQVEGLLAGCHMMDALSDFEFYRRGLVATPIPGNNHIQPFLDAGVQGLWTYYCCSQTHKVSNMFIAFPSYRNRVLGVQLFKYGIAGFLQWGYNFYNSHLSDYPIDPYLTTDAEGWVPAGDPFQVYPGPDGMPEESIRMAVTFQALQDLRAMERLAALAGKDFVTGLIDRGLDAPVTFEAYPRSKEYLLSLRKRINEEIVKRERKT